MGQRLRDNKYIFFGNVLQFDARYRDPSPNWGVIGLKLMTVTKKHQGGESRTRDGEYQELAAGSVDQLQITKCSPILARSLSRLILVLRVSIPLWKRSAWIF